MVFCYCIFLLQHIGAAAADVLGLLPCVGPASRALERRGGHNRDSHTLLCSNKLCSGRCDEGTEWLEASPEGSPTSLAKDHGALVDRASDVSLTSETMKSVLSTSTEAS